MQCICGRIVSNWRDVALGVEIGAILGSAVTVLIAGQPEHAARNAAHELSRGYSECRHEQTIIEPLARARIGIIGADYERIADSLAVLVERPGRSGHIYLVQGR